MQVFLGKLSGYRISGCGHEIEMQNCQRPMKLRINEKIIIGHPASKKLDHINPPVAIQTTRMCEQRLHCKQHFSHSDLIYAGADLPVIQRLVGHTSVNTTARYDHRGKKAAGMIAL
jgi:hypothetical protein